MAHHHFDRKNPRVFSAKTRSHFRGNNISISESEGNSGSLKTGDPENPIERINPQVNEYEKRRLCRIHENKARLEALGLAQMATPVIGLSPSKDGKCRRKGKSKLMDDDEYVPKGDDDGSSSFSSGGDYNDDDDSRPHTSPASKMKKIKAPAPKKKKVPIQSFSDNSNFVDDDALKQAIALSLKDSIQTTEPTICEFDDQKKSSSNARDGSRRLKKKNPMKSRVQMSEDDLILYFFRFDEVGKGNITAKDVERMANDHDFTWTTKEICDMIRCFDGDRDGKLSLDDFRKIARRCNMIQGCETPII